MIVGRNFLVKINANIGTAPLPSMIEEEVEKPFGPAAGSRYDITGLRENIHETREWIIRNSPANIGTVPIYKLWKK
jgi:phosphomethylpyrimidine synthase